MSSENKTLDQFYQYISQRKVMAVRCNTCDAVFLPPRRRCVKCGSRDVEWTQLKGTGELQTYTVIHVAPPQFQPLAPYAVGIVRLDEGPQLFGMIRGVEHKALKRGLRLKLNFEEQKQEAWPQWPRYHFVPEKS
ncbi:MAG: Zn-ribbon domain-containing OB-fold protein [Aigarchaeota archaeon]|nr:Zn-ribbon domain-containing OB-fold protein [Aigarchaeota archaeon]